MGLLESILAARRQQTEAARRVLPLVELKARVADLPPRRAGRFVAAIRAASAPEQGRVAVIAELKRYSPSAGPIRPDLDLVAMTRIFEAGGAAALSVLTEQHYFGGNPRDLELVRQVTERPLLCKDFLVEPYTVYEARLRGADAVLLITRLLSAQQLVDLLGLAHDLGLDALVEIHGPDELPLALASGAELIGINNRDLDSLRIDLSRVRELAPLVPGDRVVIAESGYKHPADVAGLAKLGVRAVLVGESVLRATDPALHLRQLAAAAG
ncbi:MAG: indole-3-glycerol phosphate synthase TrpC [Limnochordales bacterium]|nr:indole-3-glycerol phosphate synthase TrpC [Limnochordales bacterium]